MRQGVSPGGFRRPTASAKGPAYFELVLVPWPQARWPKRRAAEPLRRPVQKGAFRRRGVPETADCRKTYDDLEAKGVEFLSGLQERLYGIETVLRYDAGGWFCPR